MTPENRYPASNGSVKWRFPPVHPEGRKFAAIAAAIAVLAWLFVPWLTWPLIILTVWVLAFFRDPVRVTPRDENLFIPPADGLITLIQNVPQPRELLGPEGLGYEEMTRFSIFLSVFDVHINRNPTCAKTRKRVGAGKGGSVRENIGGSGF